MNFIQKELIPKGWSGDQKYAVISEHGEKYLLRFIPRNKVLDRPKLYCIQRHLAAMGVPMSLPVKSGTSEEGFYTLYTWINGQDAREAIPQLTGNLQYSYGFEAGKILKTIHSIPAPANQSGWHARMNAKIDRKIQQYQQCPIHFEGDAFIFSYLENNRHLLHGRPQCFQHGDYHIGNMMLENGNLVIIDFDHYDFGDPFSEFDRIVWCAQEAPSFACGMVNGYFENNVPVEFWKLLALYIGSNMLSSIPWAIPFGDEEISTMLKQAADVLSWYDNMRSVVPAWYQAQ